MTRHLLVVALAILSLFAACGDDDSTEPGDNTSPVRVTNLAVVDAGDNSLTLEWTAPGDDGASGTAKSYQIRRSSSPINGANFASATPVPNPPTPVAGGNTQGFIVTGLDTTLVTHFALRATDEAGNTSLVSNDAAWVPAGTPPTFIKDIPAFKDNAMYQESDNVSNGSGAYIFTGKTSTTSGTANIRRALLAFAISDSLPAGAVIDSVRLTLHVSKTPEGTLRAISLHRVTADWGEGASDAGDPGGAGTAAMTGDATWGYRFYNTLTWTTPGGEFNAPASAQTSVGLPGFYSWTSAQMEADVQSWLTTPANNFGWMIRGVESTNQTARRLDARENTTASNRPKLTVVYHMP